MSTNPSRGYSTIHHLPFENRELRHQVGYGDRDPDEETFETAYRPAETILDVTDRDRAYHHAQGEIVNTVQDARHMVRSASVGDIIEIVYPSDRREFHLVDAIGFTELEFEAPAEPTHASSSKPPAST
ncbi:MULTISPECIES: YodL domain-containing protein [Haloferacaceae]|uniref:YodL domain-containing protein n=2 Tax=Haloferacaceae TaxID=1644056 RepID=A0ABD6DAW7_9EURY|nr:MULTISPECIES: YodL domain-containing protein [Halorubraceae]